MTWPSIEKAQPPTHEAARTASWMPWARGLGQVKRLRPSKGGAPGNGCATASEGQPSATASASRTTRCAPAGTA